MNVNENKKLEKYIYVQQYISTRMYFIKNMIHKHTHTMSRQ